MDQSATPLIDALHHCATRPNAPFHTPGHKRGQGLTPRHQKLFGTRPFQADLPELPELDNLFAPEGVIRQAQHLAAEAFGATRTWFLVNGSTCGIQAAILATCGPGDKIILPRNVHSSAISGLILSGAVPIYISPTYSADWDMALGVQPTDIESALAQHPDAKAVLIVSPTYHGICSDVSAIAQITHTHSIPLIIDEAHAPHFAFHPDLPPSALISGADLTIQSAHKVLSAFTQAAMLHVQGDRIDQHRISQCLQLTQSTSPSYLLLGSLDAARHQMATGGPELMERTLAMADQACEKLSEIEGLRVLQPKWGVGYLLRRRYALALPRRKHYDYAQPPGEWGGQTNYVRGDRTRLTVDVSRLGLTGFDADELLGEKFQVTAELPALRHIMFIVSLGNTTEDIAHLVAGFERLCKDHPPIKHAVMGPNERHTAITRPQATPSLGQTVGYPQPPLTPRKAFFSSKRSVPIDQALGQICAETICPYPPGIPTLLPGEPISEHAIAHLQAILAAGGTLTGCQDPTLQTILIVKPTL